MRGYFLAKPDGEPAQQVCFWCCVLSVCGCGCGCGCLVLIPGRMRPENWTAPMNGRVCRCVPVCLPKLQYWAVRLALAGKHNLSGWDEHQAAASLYLPCLTYGLQFALQRPSCIVRALSRFRCSSSIPFKLFPVSPLCLSIAPSRVATSRGRDHRCSGLDLTQDLFRKHSAAALIPRPGLLLGSRHGDQ